MRELFFAQKGFIESEGRVLLVRKAPSDPHHPGKWEVPGGRMIFGEDVDDHLRREVREEVGLDVDVGAPFFVWQWQFRDRSPTAELRETQIVAVARRCTARSTKLSDANRVQEDHLAEASWVRSSSLLSYDLIPNMVPVVKAYLALAL